MSTVSGIGTSGTSLLQYLEQLRKAKKSTSTTQTDGTAQSDAARGSRPSGPPSADFDQKLTKELESQGFTGTKLSDLRTKIQEAMSSATQSTDGTADRGQSVRTAVENVLKDAGVNVDKLNEDMGIGKDAPADSSQAQSAFMQMLQNQGIDPKEFLDRLQSMVENSNGQSVDISKLFSGVPVGSEVDVMA